MIRLLVATTNPGKVREIGRLLQDHLDVLQLFSLADLKIGSECPETGRTFTENACQKARCYSRLAPGFYTLADDSGLVVEALEGRPGIHSARFAGPDADDQKNIDKLLTEMAEQDERRAKFVCAAALARGGEVIASFNGEVRGTLLRERQGEGGFGYDPIFYYPPLQKTFAQLSSAQKNEISHRARALAQFKDYFPTLLT